MVYFVKKYIKKGQYCPMFMNKSGTPKKNKDRPTIKVSSINTGYVKKWKDKQQSIADWVNDAIEAKHRENEREKKASDYKRMVESDSFYKIEKLKKDHDGLIREVNRLENKVSVLVKENARTMKYFIKIKDEIVATSEIAYKRIYARDKKAAKRIFKR